MISFFLISFQLTSVPRSNYFFPLGTIKHETAYFFNCQPERQRNRPSAGSLPMPSAAGAGWGPKPGVKSSIQISHVSVIDPTTWVITFISQRLLCGKLQSGGTISKFRHYHVGHGHPNWYLNHWTKHRDHIFQELIHDSLLDLTIRTNVGKNLSRDRLASFQKSSLWPNVVYQITVIVDSNSNNLSDSFVSSIIFNCFTFIISFNSYNSLNHTIISSLLFLLLLLLFPLSLSPLLSSWGNLGS